MVEKNQLLRCLIECLYLHTSIIQSSGTSVVPSRLSINLGFSFGPFLGGIIIAYIGYSGLFWVDGITCVAAIILILTAAIVISLILGD